jgi:hypothetical protein
MTKHERECWRADSGAYVPARILQSALSDIDERDAIIRRLLVYGAWDGLDHHLSGWNEVREDADTLLEGTNGTASDQ